MLDEPTSIISPEGEAAGPQSLMEALRAKRQEIAANKETDIRLPGYDNPIVLVRYRVLDGKETQDIAKRNQKIRDRFEFGTAVSLDTIIRACTGFYYTLPDDPSGEVHPLNDIQGEHLTKYDSRTADYFGLETESARDVVIGIFGGNEVAVGQHAVQLSRWMGNTSREIDSDLLGE